MRSLSLSSAIPKQKVARSSGRKAKAQLAEKLKVGDHVTWNSEAGRVSGTIIRIHKNDVEYKGYTHHATPGDPQYEIKSDKTEHVAMHKGPALTRKD
jgi:hypothetical protein